MATAVQNRRGTAAQHDDGDGFTGLEGEITVDTTNDTVRVHDGTLKGGHRLAKHSEVEGVNSLSEILALSNTTGGTKIEVDNTSGGVDLIDSAKIRLGTGNDLEIYHDGSNSFIQDVGTGSLIIDSAHFGIRTGATDTTDTTPVEHSRMSIIAGAAGTTAFACGNESSGDLSTGMTNPRLVLQPAQGGVAGNVLLKGNVSIGAADTADDGTPSSGTLSVTGFSNLRGGVSVTGNTHTSTLSVQLTSNFHGHIKANQSQNISSGNEDMHPHGRQKTICVGATGDVTYTFPEFGNGLGEALLGETWHVVNTSTHNIICARTGSTQFQKLSAGSDPVLATSATIAKGGVAEFTVTADHVISVFGSGIS
tara:strand:+ start:410 stop:1504 length:1095 start_codon:yes stop_codon:yes gene_type:complete